LKRTYTDPTVISEQTYFWLTHKIGVRFRFIFPKVVRLSIGGTLIIYHSWNYFKFNRDSDFRKYSDGSETSFNSSYENNDGNTASITNQINPFLELDFEIVKDYAIITLGWSPLVTLNYSPILGSSIDTAEKVSSTNILNLACWNLSAIVKFK